MRCPHCHEAISLAEIKEDQHQAVLALRMGGQSIQRIAAELGLSKATVHSHLKGSGLELIGLPHGPRPKR